MDNVVRLPIRSNAPERAPRIGPEPRESQLRAVPRPRVESEPRLESEPRVRSEPRVGSEPRLGSGPVQRAGSGPARRARSEPLWREVVGRQLRTERAERGERIVDVADRAGVAPQYLSELERGVKDPSSEVLAAVTGALGLSVAELTRRASQQIARPRFTGPVCLAA